jgi:hypothetical protein
MLELATDIGLDGQARREAGFARVVAGPGFANTRSVAQFRAGVWALTAEFSAHGRGAADGARGRAGPNALSAIGAATLHDFGCKLGPA